MDQAFSNNPANDNIALDEWSRFVMTNCGFDPDDPEDVTYWHEIEEGSKDTPWRDDEDD